MMRILDRILLAIAALSLFFMGFIFWSDEDSLVAHSVRRSKGEVTTPVLIQNVAPKDHLELKTADVDLALERYFDEIRKSPEKEEEDLRLVEEIPDSEDSDTGFLNAEINPEPTAKPQTPAPDKPKRIETERVQVFNHEVKSGDSIWRLAKKYQVNTQTIVNANKMKEKAVIQVGDVLKIPDRPGIFYTAKKKESLRDIGKRFKVDTQLIARSNGLNKNEIFKGDEIFLPGAKAIPEIFYVKQKVFSWPIKANYRLTSGYGWRTHPLSGNKAFHTGIDIGASMKTPIYAAASGVVVFSGDGGSYGNMIIIRHKNGLYTVYGHASRLLAKKGIFVKKGQKIALVGSTGASTGAHLHFEIKSQERYVNPLVAMKKTEKVAVKRKVA